MAPGRGRRGEKKERKQELAHNDELNADFIALDDAEDGFADQPEASSNPPSGAPARDNRSSFFGLLDRAELEYFKNAESVLATNSLNLNEREPFLDNLFEEARGKELKLATNQVCSKLIERMVQLANKDQKLQILTAFEPFAADLAYQKFSSHCLEAIILATIPIPEAEETLTSLNQRITEYSIDLAYDKYASHVLSSLILGLSGMKENLRSKKSQLARKHTEIADEKEANLPHTPVVEVSAPLRKCGCQLVTHLINSFDQVEARRLAIDPTSSPVAQVIIMAEASLMSGFSFVDAILTNGSAFISHCLSDSIGSHFLDTVVRVLPPKKVSKFIDTLPLAKLAGSENDASRFLVQSVVLHSTLPKRRKIDLLQKDLKPLLGHNVGLSVAALETDFTAFAPVITETIGEGELNMTLASHTALYEKLSQYGPFVDKAVDSIVAMDDKALMSMGVDPTQSFVLQSLLTASAPLIARRKLLNKLVALVPQYALNAYGSHIVDSMWFACYRLKFARERIAGELIKLEASLKHSPYGRKVWKNWNMEKYLRKRNEWFTIVKHEEDELKEKLEPDAKSGIAKAAEAAASSSAASHKKRKLVK